jgi:lysyl-tRNA synthetase class 2
MTDITWRPTATLAVLKQRAAIIEQIRRFFAAREVWEVDTPLLASHSVTDPYMAVLTADNPQGSGQAYYLQTSPEYAMKRLLAAGSGAIYQLCKAFRKAERGSRHNPEFTMLEWYRPGFDHHQLMDEVEALVAPLLAAPATTAPTTAQLFERCSYRQLFQQHFELDPHRADCQQLQRLAKQRLDVQMHSDNKHDWLNLLLAEIIEPSLGRDRPVFIYDYPAGQAALAKLAADTEGEQVAQRFELYSNGLELANGYYELSDADELQQRFAADNLARQQAGLNSIAEDSYLIAAMQAGLPDCAGVALGLDRLLMLLTDSRSIDQVIAFPADRA